MKKHPSTTCMTAYRTSTVTYHVLSQDLSEFYQCLMRMKNLDSAISSAPSVMVELLLLALITRWRVQWEKTVWNYSM
jgi:hypothetical protein